MNVTGGKVTQPLVDDEPSDIRYGELHSHERNLDFRAGVLWRQAEWSSPSGRRVRVSSTRRVSLVHPRSLAAIRYEVESTDRMARLLIQSELVTNEPPPSATGDPRASVERSYPKDHYREETT